MAVCLAQIEAQAFALAPALSRPSGMIDVDAKLVAKELRKRPIGKIEHIAALHLEHPINDRQVLGANLGNGRGQGSPQTERLEPSVHLPEGVLPPLIGGALSEQFGAITNCRTLVGPKSLTWRNFSEIRR